MVFQIHSGANYTKSGLDSKNLAGSGTHAEFFIEKRAFYRKLLINLAFFGTPNGIPENCSCAGHSIRMDLGNPGIISSKSHCICSAETAISVLSCAIYPLGDRSGSSTRSCNGDLVILTGLYNARNWITKNCIRAGDSICEGLSNPDAVRSVLNLSCSAKAAKPAFARASYPCTVGSGSWCGGNSWSECHS
jgi:hypothetical protein